MELPKIYCINLDRRPDRWQVVSEQFQKHGLEVERFAAIDAQVYKMKPTEAFTMSHYYVIDKASYQDLPSVLIFEDDVVLHDNFKPALEYCMLHLPDDWDILYLGGSHREKPVPVNDHIYKITHTLTTHAYILRNTMYAVVLNSLWNSKEPADCIYTQLQKQFNCYVTNPPLAWQRDGFSDIEGRYMDYPWIKTNDQ